LRRLTNYIALSLPLLFVPRVHARPQEHPVPLGENPDPAKCVECHADKSKGEYVHTAIAMGCTTCHAVTSKKGVTAIKLVSPASELCFTCHQKSTDEVLHGPYAQGNCSFCHSPHASDFPNQILASPEDLCMGCHVRARLKVNRRKRTATAPWGVTMTLKQLKGWQYINLNKALTANHPVEGHPVIGPNTAAGKGAPEITCLSCHQPHHSKWANLLPPNLPNDKGVMSDQTGLCVTCHKYPYY
jgi:predicted CXXCH cytochrome family protein